MAYFRHVDDEPNFNLVGRKPFSYILVPLPSYLDRYQRFYVLDFILLHPASTF